MAARRGINGSVRAGYCRSLLVEEPIWFNKTWRVATLPEFLRGRDVLKRLRDLCGPLHLSPGAYTHLMAAGRLQAELLEKMIGFGNRGSQIKFAWKESASGLPGRVFQLWASGGDFISGADSRLPAQCSLMPQRQRMVHKQPLTQNPPGCSLNMGIMVDCEKS